MQGLRPRLLHLGDHVPGHLDGLVLRGTRMDEWLQRRRVLLYGHHGLNGRPVPELPPTAAAKSTPAAALSPATAAVAIRMLNNELRMPPLRTEQSVRDRHAVA